MPGESPPANPEQPALVETPREARALEWESGDDWIDLHDGDTPDPLATARKQEAGGWFVRGHGAWTCDGAIVTDESKAVAYILEIGINHGVEVPPFYEVAEGMGWNPAGGAMALVIGGVYCANAWLMGDRAEVWTAERWGFDDGSAPSLRAAVGVIIARAASQGIGVEWPREWPDGTAPGQSHEIAVAVEAIGEVLPDEPAPTPLASYQALDAQLTAGREAQHSEAAEDALLDRMDAAYRRLSDDDIATVNKARRTAMESLLREAHDAGYRHGYRNAVEDGKVDEVPVFGPDPGDSFDLWLDERGATPPEPPKPVAEWRRDSNGVLELRWGKRYARIRETGSGWVAIGTYQQTCDDEAMGRGIAAEWAQELGYEVPAYREPDERTAGVERDGMQRFLDGGPLRMLPVLPTSEAAEALIDRFVASRKAGGGPE